MGHLGAENRKIGGGLSNLKLIDKFLTKRKRDNVKNMSHVGADHVGSNLHNLYGT